MKRLIWMTLLIGCLGLAAKLAFKPPGSPTAALHVLRNGDIAAPKRIDRVRPEDPQLVPGFDGDRSLVANLIETFGHNARQIAATHGMCGLRLLNELGDTAVCLYEQRPEEFRRLCSLLDSDEEAARVVKTWDLYFDPRQADREVTALLATELNRLPPRARHLANQTPEALPFLLTDPRRTADIIDRMGAEALETLAWVDLSDGGVSLRRAIAVLDRHGKLAATATAEMGAVGLLLVERFGPLIAELEPQLGLREALRVVASAIDGLEELELTHRPATVAGVIVHLASRDLLRETIGTRYGLRLAVEFGRDGQRVIETVGAQSADLIYRSYAEGRQRNAVVSAIAQGGVSAAVAAQKYAGSNSFCRIVERDGAAAILAVAAACSAEESRAFLAAKLERTWSEAMALGALRLAGETGDATIRIIDRDGIERVRALSASELQFYQLLPLYDLSHLGSVLVHGYVPTRGEVAWAGVDAGLIVWDALALLALQPEGVVAAEGARVGAKSGARLTMKAGARTAAQETGESLAGRAARSASSGLARGSSELADKQTLTVGEHAAAQAVRTKLSALARRSAIRLTDSEIVAAATGATTTTLAALPRNRLTKYVVANTAQASAGLLAIRKMDEYLEGRRASKATRSVSPNDSQE